ncbi:YbjN domain-containing protein [Leptospira brenneri]|uniref:YbjN domain-containing protein n=1 Tax=Leptospira brenneri TaxID=2023182 RepID=A0A2M9Y2T2_9LEPT|nr:YbjN domain-containing protein [Leptospira brenneri]PJZ45861.1 bacterial sensory transduction regulator [Leptospira brenneri]TGK91492.1 YbjN domain-containing protein [Leptospira brenneri]
MNQMKKIIVLLFFFSFFEIFPEPPKTKQPDPLAKSANVYHTVDKSMIRKLVVSLGYSIISDEERLMILGYQDSKVGLMFSNETSIQFYSSFNSDKANKVNLANRWNQKMRYSRSYLDTDGRLILESDFDYSGGVSEESIREFLQKFQILNSQFTTLLILAE